MDDIRGAPITCAPNNNSCPTTHDCAPVPDSDQAVCCLKDNEDMSVAATDEDRPQTSMISLAIKFTCQEGIRFSTPILGGLDHASYDPLLHFGDSRGPIYFVFFFVVCEYLHEFSESMEGTQEGMTLALPQPECDSDGGYIAEQCHNEECWCVDHFGTEIPRTRANGNASVNCDVLRERLDCLDLTCRLGCEYGFVLSEETRCPQCHCRDPCNGVRCKSNEQCQLVEVNCKDHYCPPVPACKYSYVFHSTLLDFVLFC